MTNKIATNKRLEGGMRTRLREHHGKWKTGQDSDIKVSVTVMLSGEVMDLMDRQMQITGSTIADIIEEAVVNLFNSIPSYSTSKKETASIWNKLDVMDSPPDAETIYKAVAMYYNAGADAKRIAYNLTMGDLKTFSGNDQWTEEDVKKILEKL